MHCIQARLICNSAAWFVNFICVSNCSQKQIQNQMLCTEVHAVAILHAEYSMLRRCRSATLIMVPLMVGDSLLLSLRNPYTVHRSKSMSLKWQWRMLLYSKLSRYISSETSRVVSSYLCSLHVWKFPSPRSGRLHTGREEGDVNEICLAPCLPLSPLLAYKRSKNNKTFSLGDKRSCILFIVKHIHCTKFQKKAEQ